MPDPAAQLTEVVVDGQRIIYSYIVPGGDLEINQYTSADKNANYGSNGYPPGGASDGIAGARGGMPKNPLPPCSE